MVFSLMLSAFSNALRLCSYQNFCEKGPVTAILIVLCTQIALRESKKNRRGSYFANNISFIKTIIISFCFHDKTSIFFIHMQITWCELYP